MLDKNASITALIAAHQAVDDAVRRLPDDVDDKTLDAAVRAEEDALRALAEARCSKEEILIKVDHMVQTAIAKDVFLEPAYGDLLATAVRARL